MTPKARIVKAKYTSIARQRLGKHIPAATNTQATIETVFFAWSVTRSYLEHNWRYSAVEGAIVEC
jgi:hypothetical protein